MTETGGEGGLHPALAHVLREDRDSLNRRFQLHQRAGARIDESSFLRHLRTTVNELTACVAAVHGERVRIVVNTLFDVSLDLFTAAVLGPGAKHPYVAAAWRDVLPQAATLLARDPLRVAGCLSNAVEHLASHSSARPAEWIRLMACLAPHCDGVSQWLNAGKVAAWRAGLVQHRMAAIQIARGLPWKLSAIVLDAQKGITESDWRQRLQQLETDHWYLPQNDFPTAAERSLRIVRTTGGFRGFGGPCLRPPIVKAQGDRLFVSDGDAVWQLLADTFGTLWHRVPVLPSNVAASDFSSRMALNPAGGLSWHGNQQQFDELAGASSFACDGQTLAVTLPTSHHVFLVAYASKENDEDVADRG